MHYNPEELNEILNIFKAEGEEIIEELNDGFLELEKNPIDKSPLKKLFQLSHSLKGSARMLGFNAIQDIAHKIEDILSYFKKDDVDISEFNFQVIYEACDLLSELVVRAVKQEEIKNTEKIISLVDKLTNFLNIDGIENVTIVEVEEPKTVIERKNIDINAILLELIFVLDKSSNEEFSEIMSIVEENLKQLQEFFEDSQYENIKQEINLIFDLMNSQDKSQNEILNEVIIEVDNLKKEIYQIYSRLNIKLKTEDIQLIKEEKKEEQFEEPENDEEEENEVISLLDFILSNLSKIKFNKDYVLIIKENFTKIINICGDRRIEQILTKILKILDSFIDKNILIDNECYIVILQCTYLAKRLALKEKEENLYNLNFLLQRLDVVEDLFEVRTEKKEVVPKRETTVENNTLPFQISDLKKNLHSIDMQEIKTLRVDTVKLDNLIAQTGELLINGIKTREHLNKLSQINSKVNQWNSVSKKIINYLKYLEKKGFFNSEYDDGTNLFYKKAQAFFINNAETINEIQNDFGNLYKIMSEDDNKLHQTVLEIESIAKDIRVLPLATIFHSFPRMIRDIAKENGKKIDFIVTGSDTTVDKKLIEEIKMPLIHILRNAVSHGIEIPEERIRNNKAETGLVRLSAKQVENNVIITIEDDGYGINVEKVKQTALFKGLFTEEEINNLDNEQLMKLLFLPGFSTEDSVTEISGRGIGLDIVKTKINNLNGDIFIDSVLNKGCKVSIKLPVSMSTIKTFVVMVNTQKFAVPINSIKFVKQINVEEIFKRNGQNYIIFDEHSVPVYSLSEVLGEKYEINDVQKQLTVIIIENQERQAAFITDKLLGAQEVFHKKLVPPIIRVKNISGFTTLSTGEICLIINPYELIRNTVMSNYISVQNFKSIELLVDNYYGKDKKILVLETEKDSLFHISQDLQNSFSKLEIFKNVSEIYEYFDKNKADVLVVKIDSEEDTSLNLVKYVKSDENLYKMFVIVVSTIDKILLSNMLRGYFVDAIINPSTYDSDKLIKQIKDV